MGDPPEKKEVHWNPQLERILACDGERALCYSWLHTRAEKRYSRWTTQVALPVIVLSGVNGFVSGIGSSIPMDPGMLGIGVGALSLGIGLLNTVGTQFGWAKRSESHRMVGIQQGKIHRSVMIELALPRDERLNPNDMLKMVRDQMDRLHETAPQIPDSIIQDFRDKFADNTPEVSKPEITNGLDPIEVQSDDFAKVAQQIISKEVVREVALSPNANYPRTKSMISRSPQSSAASATSTAPSVQSVRTGAFV